MWELMRGRGKENCNCLKAQWAKYSGIQERWSSVVQSCLTLCDPMDCKTPSFPVHESLQAGILKWVVFPFSRGSSPTQGSNPGLPHCRQVLYQLSHKGKPKNTGVGSLSLFQWIFLTQESNQVSCFAGGFFTNWAMREALSLRTKILIVHGINQLKFAPISFQPHTFFTIFLEGHIFFNPQFLHRNFS